MVTSPGSREGPRVTGRTPPNLNNYNRFQNVFLIYNPVAGKLVRNPRLLGSAIGLLKEQFGPVELSPTTGPRTATAIAGECVRRGADLVVVLGGDGTLNEVLNGLAGTGVCCAALPGGTANVLGIEIGAGADVKRAIRGLPERVPYSVPLGVMRTASGEARYFLLMAGAGIDAVIVNRVNAALKRKVGKAAYWVGGFSLLGSPLDEFEVCINGVSYRASFALASRVRNYGGDLTIATSANLLHPEFEVVLFEGRSTFRYLKYFAGVLTRTAKKMSGVHYLRSAKLELRPCGKESPIQLDGEAAGQLPVTIEIAAERVTMLLPREFVARREMGAGPISLQ